MQGFGGWKVLYFLQVSVYFSVVLLLSCQQVKAKRLECYECEIRTKGLDSEQDPCYDPQKSKAPSRVCSDTPGEPAEALACYKQYDKSEENSTGNPFLFRSCRYARKNDEPCYMAGSNISICLCNDRDLCNDEIGYNVSESSFDGSRPMGVGSKFSVAVSARFRLPQTVLALLSGCVLGLYHN